MGSRLEAGWRWGAVSIAMLSPESESRESGGSCKVLLGGGVEGVLAREGSLGLVVVAGIIAFSCSGAASMLSRLPMASSQAASNILAMRCWPWG